MPLEHVEFEYFDQTGVRFDPSSQIPAFDYVGFNHAQYEGNDGLSATYLHLSDTARRDIVRRARLDAPLVEGEDFNVRGDLSGQIFMVDASGPCAGETYQNENGGTIDWLVSGGDSTPPLVSVTSHNSRTVETDWTTTAKTDVAATR